jgi:hypothetical protein
MIYRGIKAKRSDKASAIFLYAGEYTKAPVFCSMFLSSNYDIIVIASISLLNLL